MTLTEIDIQREIYEGREKVRRDALTLINAAARAEAKAEAAEAKLREAEAQAEARVKEAEARAEARVKEAETKAEARLKEAVAEALRAAEAVREAHWIAAAFPNLHP